MSLTTSPIEWTDVTWSPTRGCRRISPGCENCYAERVAHRFSQPTVHAPHPPYEGLITIGAQGPRWNGKGKFVLSRLFDPLRLRTPSKIFVNSMSDLFFEAFTDEEIDDVLAVMLLAPEHTFQVLTKRHNRMRAYLSNPGLYQRVIARADAIRVTFPKRVGVGISNPTTFPAKHIWWGVSVENQEYAEKRIPALLTTPAAVRFVSYEPALGPIDFARWLRPSADQPGLSWLIVGGESGTGARPFDIRWAQTAISQCRDAGVPVFFKQAGSNAHDSRRSMVGGWEPGDPEPDTMLRLGHKKGANPAEWPEFLRVQQSPTTEITW